MRPVAPRGRVVPFRRPERTEETLPVGRHDDFTVVWSGSCTASGTSTKGELLSRERRGSAAADVIWYGEEGSELRRRMKRVRRRIARLNRRTTPGPDGPRAA
jgi:hypothetical protein